MDKTPFHNLDLYKFLTMTQHDTFGFYFFIAKKVEIPDMPTVSPTMNKEGTGNASTNLYHPKEQ